MIDAVLDSSALIAFLRGEPAAELVGERLLRRATISAVNWAEVTAKAIDAGEPLESGIGRLMQEGGMGQLLEIAPFLQEDAERSAALRKATRAAGLSLGDRACLALAQHLDRPAITADRAWLTLDLPIEVIAIR